jgi:hypothetical protein
MGPSFISLTVIGAIIVLIYTAVSIRVINQGDEALVERLGRYHRKLRPGLSFIVPGIDSIVLKESMRERILELSFQDPSIDGKHDLLVKLTLYWKILDLERTYYSVEDIEEALKNLSETYVRSCLTELGEEEFRSSLGRISSEVIDPIDALSEKWGVKVIDLGLVVSTENEGYFLGESSKENIHYGNNTEGLIKVVMNGEINWIVYSRAVEIMSRKGVQLLVRDWEEKLDSDQRRRSELRIEYFPKKEDSAKIYNDLLLTYGKLKVESDNANLQQEIKPGSTGTEEKSLEKIEDMFRQIQALLITSQKQNNIVVNNLMSGSTRMEDQSKRIEIGYVGRDLNASGQSLNLGLIEVSGLVAESIGQLPESTETERNLKGMLIRLKDIFEEADDEVLTPEDKADALEQIKTLAEASDKPDAEKKSISGEGITFLEANCRCHSDFTADSNKLADRNQ